MVLVDLSLSDFFDAYAPSSVFASKPFITLNADKADNIICLSMANDKGKHMAGIIIGNTGDELACPFSAPFGEIYCNENISIETAGQFAELLHNWLNNRLLRLTLAPTIYNNDKISKLCAAFSPLARRAHYNLSYHYLTANVPNYRSELDSTGRWHLNRAIKAGLSFTKTDDIARAYAVIRRNREEKGYYLSMTEAQVRETTSVAVKADCFLLELDGKDVAAAIVFHVAEGVVQVVYWGHLAEYNEHHPMALLPLKVFEYYNSIGINTVDLGTAHLSDGVPNTGLCKFKESIGGIASLKPTFIL